MNDKPPVNQIPVPIESTTVGVRNDGAVQMTFSSNGTPMVTSTMNAEAARWLALELNEAADRAERLDCGVSAKKVAP